jgi:hypothetical protein
VFGNEKNKEIDMKKILLFLTAFALLFALVACSKTASQTTQSGSSASLSTAAELLVGTIKLEGTDQAVTSDQAKQLLPLWQMLQSLSTSSTAATEEINAVVDQIKSLMTSDQMDKITAMNLTQQDVMTLMSQNGPTANGTEVSTPMALNGLPDSGSAPSGGMPSGGGAPSGGMPSGGSAPSGGNMPSGVVPPSGGVTSGGGDAGAAGGPGMSTTPQAVRSNGMADQVPAPLLNELIQLLQEKVQP